MPTLLYFKVKLGGQAGSKNFVKINACFGDFVNKQEMKSIYEADIERRENTVNQKIGALHVFRSPCNMFKITRMAMHRGCQCGQ